MSELRFKLGLLTNYLRIRLHYIGSDLFRLLPRVICFSYTHRCNLHCSMCAYEDPGVNKTFEEMPFNTIQSVFKKIKQSYKGLRYLPLICLTGGEPYIKPEINELLIFLNNLNLKIVLFTNGTLMNGQSINTLLKLPNTSLVVSLDGCARVHDKVRNLQGSFDITTQNLGRLFVKGFPMNRMRLSYTISSLNFDCISEFMEEIIGRGWKTPVEFLFLCYTTEESVKQLKKEGLRHFNYDNLTYRYAPTKLNLINIPVLIGQIEKVKSMARKNNILVLFRPIMALSKLEEYYYAYDKYALTGRCFEPTRVIKIRPDGVVYPCNISLPIGNVVTQDMRDIYFSERARRFRKILQARLFPTCKRCSMLRYMVRNTSKIG